jgi:hypothetical protein
LASGAAEPKPLEKLLPRPPQRERAGVRATCAVKTVLSTTLFGKTCFGQV